MPTLIEVPSPVVALGECKESVSLFLSRYYLCLSYLTAGERRPLIPEYKAVLGASGELWSQEPSWVERPEREVLFWPFLPKSRAPTPAEPRPV
jgi:hypothetical protein